MLHEKGVEPDRLAGLPALLGELGESAGPLLAECTTKWLAEYFHMAPRDLEMPGNEPPSVQRQPVDIEPVKEGRWGGGWGMKFDAHVTEPSGPGPAGTVTAHVVPS